MTTVTPADLRNLYPEFTSTVYPDPLVSAWITNATGLVNEDRWGDSYTLGVCLVTAHFLAMGRIAGQEAANGGAPGMRPGAISSEGGDSVNVSFDLTSTALKDAGMWNATAYGRQYITLARMMGAGPMQVNTSDDGGTIASAAWAGPPIGFPF